MSVHRLFCLILFLAIVFSSQGFAETGYNDPAMILSFADWLYSEKEFERAAGEYYRYYFVAPESQKDGVLSKIGFCYEGAGDFAAAKKVYETFLAEYPESKEFEDVYYRLSYCLFRLGEHDATAVRLAEVLAAGAAQPARLLLLTGVNQLALEQWDAAQLTFQAYCETPDAPQKETAERLSQFAISAKNIPEKSPVLAGILSAIFPGLGKFYAERNEDAIASIILVSLFGGLAAYSFYTDGVESFSGWTFASLAGIFYLGDIWGSAVAAADYNDHQKRLLKESVDETISEFLP
ncbi:MAG: tetratricopeptide repeat protein [Spirochaetales bacterium]|nr:tetratricopeptide repeat protein [Spirochaetales bacterium]